MHMLLTVFVETEHASTEEALDTRVLELMAPYCSWSDVAPHEENCLEDVHDESCCNGTLTVWTTRNPAPRCGVYELVGSGESCWEDATPGSPSFALLLPDEGWSDQDSFYGRVVGANEDLTEWNRSFEVAARSYRERGFVAVLVDYDATTPGRNELFKPRLDGLASLLPAFEAPDVEFGTSHGEQGTMPWFELSATASRFFHVAYADGWVRPEVDWGQWQQTAEAQRLQEDRRALDDATVPDLVRLLTLVIRRDRFVEGSLEEDMQSGLITAVLRRIEQLRRDL